MANIPGTQLFTLIKSLSKSEKRYFRLFAGRNGDNSDLKFVKLFDLLDKMETPDEEWLQKKWSRFNLKQLPNLKAHLYKQVLIALKQYHTSHSIDLQLRNQLDFTEILYSKGLYEQAMKMLEKAKKQAAVYDRSVIMLDIVELEKKIMAQTVSEKNEDRVKKLMEETRQLAGTIENIHIFSSLMLKLSSLYVKMGFIRNSSDLKMVQDYFYSHLPDYEEEKLSFQEKMYLYYSYVSYYFFVQDFVQGEVYARKYLLLFENHPEMKITRTDFYMKGLNFLLVVCHKRGDNAAFDETYRKLLRLPNIKGLYLSENLALLHFRYKYMHKINQYFMQGNFTGGCKIISVVEDELDRFALKMDKHDVLVFYYKVACLYFGASNFKKALIWLNRIIQSKDVDLREDILSFARIMSLISHFELRHTDLLEYQLKSTYRFLWKKQHVSRFYVYLIDFMNKLSKDLPEKQLKVYFKELKGKLEIIEKQKFENRPFLYFDIISWLESKLEDCKVEEVIAEKVKKRLARLR